jgi:hypothetical protein
MLAIILDKSRMRKCACTDLCGGRPAMVVPTATAIHMSEKSLARADPEQPGLRFNADAVVDGSTDSLLAAEITFGRLHRNVSEKKLDLVQFSTG